MVDSLKLRIILLGLAMALVLAGCASNNNAGKNPTGDNGTGATGTAPTPSMADARSLLAGAVGGTPQKYGMSMAFSDTNGKSLMTATGSVDNATHTVYFEIKFDPSLMKANPAVTEADSAAFANGIALYQSPTGGVFLVNGTAILTPATNASGQEGSFTSAATKSGPLGDLSDPSAAFAQLAGAGLNITDVSGTSWKGKPAVAVSFTDTQDGQTVHGKAVVYAETKRLAHLESDVPPSNDSSSASGFDAFSKGGKISIDLLYDNEVTVTPPDSVSRALGLAYKSDNPKFSFGGAAPTHETWTFEATSGLLPVGEVEAVVQAPSSDKSSMSMGGMGALGGVHEAWHLSLADGTKTVDGVTITFTDADHDGKVGKGDTLVITAGKDANGDQIPLPTVLLKDTKTGLYVTPGFEVFALLGGAALAAVVLRRKN